MTSKQPTAAQLSSLRVIAASGPAGMNPTAQVRGFHMHSVPALRRLGLVEDSGIRICDWSDSETVRASASGLALLASPGVS